MQNFKNTLLLLLLLLLLLFLLLLILLLILLLLLLLLLLLFTICEANILFKNLNLAIKFYYHFVISIQIK